MALIGDGPVGKAAGLVREGLGAFAATASNVAGDLVSSRPDDQLADRDEDYIRRTLPTYKALLDVYFRPKVRGLEHIPKEGPVLLVGNHSGGTLIADTFAFAYGFYDHFGPKRLFYQLAHDLAVGLPGMSIMLRKYGTLGASHENAERALDRGAAVLVYPGGDWETYRPSWRGDEIDFGGRTGFIKLALNKGVPIVPVVAIGGQETALFLTRGERMARALQLDRLLRLKVLPVQVAPPYGLTILDLPGRIPLPSQITIDVLPPVDLRERFGPKPDAEAVYDGITDEMQRALDELDEERDLPLIGTVGGRRSRGLASVPRGRDGGRASPNGGEPWRGYDRMTVPEIERRIRSRSDGDLDALRRYEQTHKRRKGVLKAVDRRRAEVGAKG